MWSHYNGTMRQQRSSEQRKNNNIRRYRVLRATSHDRSKGLGSCAAGVERLFISHNIGKEGTPSLPCRRGESMDKSMEELKEEAQDLIIDALSEAVTMGNDMDCRYKAEWLLGRLEPIIFAYAPVPDRIVKALKYGCQA